MLVAALSEEPGPDRTLDLVQVSDGAVVGFFICSSIQRSDRDRAVRST